LAYPGTLVSRIASAAAHGDGFAHPQRDKEDRLVNAIGPRCRLGLGLCALVLALVAPGLAAAATGGPSDQARYLTMRDG